MDNRKRSVLKYLVRFLFPVFVVLMLFATASCANNIPGELTDSEKLWKEQGLSNYDFTLERQCFCPEDYRGPVNIQVRGGDAVSITYVSNEEAATSDKFGDADTIDKLFTILKDAYTGKSDFGEKASNINVTYDNLMGYPETFFIDYSEMIADEEQGYTVTNLVAK